MKWVLAFALFFSLRAYSATQELTVYSVYEAARLAPIFQPFTDRTGIKVNVVFGSSAELMNRLRQEGSASPADLYLDKDLVFQSAAQGLGLYRPFRSAIVEKTVPGKFIEPGRNWFLIFYRARVIMYHGQKVSPAELSTYEALGEARWKNRLCVRTSNNSYNEALAASFLADVGPQKTLELFRGWVANFSVAPIKGDTDVLKAIAAGQCDVGIANTYYLAPLIKADPNFPVRPFFPNGAHVNGVGIGLAKSTQNVVEATRLMEYLVSKEVQAAVAGGFFQYPVNGDAPLVAELVKFGPFVESPRNVGEIGTFVPMARTLLQQAGYE